jgi:hypothetical protein
MSKFIKKKRNKKKNKESLNNSQDHFKRSLLTNKHKWKKNSSIWVLKNPKLNKLLNRLQPLHQEPKIGIRNRVRKNRVQNFRSNQRNLESQRNHHSSQAFIWLLLWISKSWVRMRSNHWWITWKVVMKKRNLKESTP